MSDIDVNGTAVLRSGAQMRDMSSHFENNTKMDWSFSYHDFLDVIQESGSVRMEPSPFGSENKKKKNVKEVEL